MEWRENKRCCSRSSSASSLLSARYPEGCASYTQCLQKVTEASLACMYPSLTAEINASRGSVLGIMDFRYAPYALGDACTWLTKLQIVASRHSLSDIEIMLITLPYKPSSGLQTHITPYNYAQVMDGLLPAFLCCRNLKSIHIFEHKRKALHRLLGAMVTRIPTWP